MRFSNDAILDESTVTADTRSPTIDIRYQLGYSLQVEWTSTTASATVKIEASNDEQAWAELSSPTQVINNNSGTTMLNLGSEQYYGFFRVFLDYTSGTVDTLKVTLGGKGI